MKMAESDYFRSYDDLQVHKLMLTDRYRLYAYKRAIEENKSLFHNKTVIDVGSGSGILAIFCAQAGAKKVYAVEAAKKMVLLSRKIIEENGFQDCIEVVEGKVEEIILPCKVEVLVSEWMGFYLLHECMLDSVIIARERFLEPNGIMFPDKCVLYGCICELPMYFSSWENLYGVNMSAFGEEIRNSLETSIQILTVPSEALLSDPVEIIACDLNTLDRKKLQEFVCQCLMISHKPGSIQGICLWFDVTFPGKKEFQLSTSPKEPPTHWKQTVIIFQQEIPCDSQDSFVTQFKFTQERNRAYGITVEVLDPSIIDHPIPCGCNNLACIIGKKHLENIERDEIKTDK